MSPVKIQDPASNAIKFNIARTTRRVGVKAERERPLVLATPQLPPLLLSQSSQASEEKPSPSSRRIVNCGQFE